MNVEEYMHTNWPTLLQFVLFKVNTRNTLKIQGKFVQAEPKRLCNKQEKQTFRSII